MATFKRGEITGESGAERWEYLADSRVRAVLLRPGSDLRWRSDVTRPETADFEALPGLAFDDGPWLVSATAPTATFARSLLTVFRAFEKVAQRPTQDAIYKFVETFGWLGHLPSVEVVQSGTDFRALHVGGSRLAGESLNWWLDELAAFSGTRAMWEATVALLEPEASRDRAASARTYLRQHVEVASDEIRYLLDLPATVDDRGSARWASVRIPGLQRLVSHGDLAATATFVVCHVINERLRDHAHPTLMPFVGRSMGHVPDCLLGAIYLRLANEVATMSRNPRSKQCPRCNETFDYGNGNRVYCSDSCKWAKKYLVSEGRWPMDVTSGRVTDETASSPASLHLPPTMPPSGGAPA